MSIRVLVADDEPSICHVLDARLAQAGFDVTIAHDGQEAVELFRQEPCQVAILDLRMPRCDGFQCLKALRETTPNLPIIFITAYATIDSAVEAMRLGADDYITKPFDTDDVVDKLSRLIKLRRLLPVSKIPQDAGGSGLLGNSRPMSELRNMIKKLSNLSTTVLITGESGTGKSAAAKELHRQGNRASKPFVYVDCSSLPATLIESELFGYEKGTFTGAQSARKGKFESAEGGTIFLDEISSLPIELQSKLLTVLQERTTYRVGSTHPIPINARFIAATNEDLSLAIDEGRFREDLFYRLNVVNLQVPPLRKRKEDIPTLAAYFFQKCVTESGISNISLDPDIYDALSSYDWPGNIRELANVIESAVVLADEDMIRVSDLPSQIFLSRRSNRDRVDGTPATGLTLREKEISSLLAALARNGGHRERTAQELGISRRTLLNKMKRLNIRYGEES